MKHTSILLSVLFLLSNTSSAAVLATVNGKTITDEDLNAVLANLPQYQKNIALKDPNAKKQLVNDLVDQELVVQEATNEKLENTKEFKDAMAQLRKQTLVNALVQKQLAPKVTEASVKDYYNKHKTRYSTDQVHVQHILLGTEKEAQEVLSEAKRPGTDFQTLAEKRSKDPSAKNTRGDVGFISRNMFDQAFTDAAFSGSAGDIVGPIKTAFGFHVIKVVERKVGKVPELAEVEQQVRFDLQKELLREYVSSLRKKAKIKE